MTDDQTPSAEAMRALFGDLVDGFRNEVVERKGQGATATDMYMLLADVERQLMDKGMDNGTRNMIVEKMRSTVRDVYRKGA